MTSYRILAFVALSPFATLALPACSNLTTPPEPEPMANESSNAPAPTAPKPSATATAAAAATPPSPAPTASSIPAPSDVAAPPANAKKTASGLAYRVLKPGTGASPKATDKVTVNYTGWQTDGKMFDSSVTRGKPITFPLNGVIKGWTEGVQLMKAGETARFWIPAELAYGEHPAGGRPGGLLVFDIELISITPGGPPPGMPQGHP
jgi:FKBP-type peptidyl-prolyl cis-trans isomerase